MVQSIIFDLDNTLVNTEALRPFRDARNWNACYSNLHKTELMFNPNDFKPYLKIGIVTNSPRSYALKILNYHNIKFDCLIAYHDTHLRKPHPEPFIKCLEIMDVLPSNSIGIGDHYNDTVAAKNANMFALGITWGDCSCQEHQKNNADMIITTPNDLKDYIETVFIEKEKLNK